jgi:histidyl-tRNA synthetase
MKDVLPAEAPRWHQVEEAAREVFRGYGYEELRPPVLEHTELFQRSIGEATDIIEKEMYTFLDRRGRSLSMRPEATASCVRAVAEAGLMRSRGELRIWYMGPMFRYEKMQKERYRQFYQIGTEIYGQEGAAADAETILVTARLWKALGLEGVRLDVNSLGTRDEQADYRERLVEYLRDHRQQLDEDSLRRLEMNPLRVLDSKNPELQTLIEAAPAPVDHLREESAQHFAQVRSILDDCGIPFRVNRRLVRGLDYYTRTVFEWLSGDLGAQSAVCGGGRYDRLFAEIGGEHTAAVGFSAGIERIIAVMNAQAVPAPSRAPQIYLAAVGDAPRARALGIAERLRDALPRCTVQVDADLGSFKAKLKRADRSGAAYALILGEDELARHCIQMKTLRAHGADTPGTQRAVALDGLVTEVGQALDRAIAAQRSTAAAGARAG